ncbi:hypothetical protein [Marinifilum caeruleilacunae]|uniref:DUF4163 domain-containing protein n=1 Tax=Marinifilum caeruleilacunae TaxID=2499076 RepID=A0ABX1WR98_9BACT|nr:hypothetical protein [Marinifilum caeruleilacunae]NOU58607.1 hypothetical protein [Marinifilum caeruleilacunae]
MNINRFYLYLSITLIFTGIISCSEDDKHSGYIDPNEELLVGLSEVEGYDHTYNYDFNILKERESVDFYVPVSFNEALNRIPADMRTKLNLFSASELPFTTNIQEANIVTSWNDKNKLVFQIQMSYLENDESYDTNFKDFFIVSITQHPENPFETMSETELETLHEDLSKREYDILNLTAQDSLYYLPKDEDNLWPRMFDYYKYDESQNRIFKESTGSYQYYAWYDGLIYKIGFNMDVEAVDEEALVRQIILGN